VNERPRSPTSESVHGGAGPRGLILVCHSWCVEPYYSSERGRPRRTIEDMPVRRSGGTAGDARIWLWVVGDGQEVEVNAESPRGNPVRVRLSPRASRRDKDLHTKH